MMNLYKTGRHALWVGLLTTLLCANAATPAPRDVVNAAGQPVRNADGSKRNYSRNELLVPPATATVTTRSQALRPAAQGSAQATAPAGTLAMWGWAALGSGIGQTGLVSATNGDDLELYSAGSGATFGGSGYWYALRWNSSLQQFDPFFVSDQPASGIRRILVVNTATARARDSRRHIVVGLLDGTILRYDLKTKALLTTVAGPCSGRDGLQALAAADLDGNGIEELISVCGDQTLAITSEGGASWSLPGIGGTEIVVGQMDNDPGLEIATTSGRVIDVDTRTVQWFWPAGFGAHLQVGDIDGDGRDELIAAESWYWVWAYDVERQLPKWSLNMPQDVGAILLADIDGDGVKDLLVGDGQWGAVKAFDALTTAAKGSITNPEHGVTQIAVVSLPGASAPRLLWGAGATSSGADHLYVADWQAKAILWQNPDLTGPFIGPVVGDLDGDGVPEIVFASSQSNSGYDSGRIIVLDSRTLAVRAISPGVAGGRYGWTGIHDIKLRDLDGDGKLEILVATDWLYNGLIEAYKLSAGNQFSLVWSNGTRPSSAFQSVEVADLDGDGRLEVLGGVAGSSQGAYVYAYDAQTGAEKWHTLHLGGMITGLAVGDFNGNGQIDFAATVRGGNTFVFNGPAHGLDAIISLASSSLTTVPAGAIPRLLIGQTNGNASLRIFDGGVQYPELQSLAVGTAAIDGISLAANGDWWVGSGGQLRRYSGGVMNFQSASYGAGFGRNAVPVGNPAWVYSAGGYGLLRLSAP